MDKVKIVRTMKKEIIPYESKNTQGRSIEVKITEERSSEGVHEEVEIIYCNQESKEYRINCLPEIALPLKEILIEFFGD